MTSAIRNNAGLKVLALCLSLFLWIFVRFTQTPFSSTINQADLQVPLKIDTNGDKMVLDAPPYVTVTVRGSKEYIQSMPVNAVGANLDLRSVAEGVGAYKVSITSPPELTVIQVDNERPLLRIEPLTRKVFPVQARIQGKPASGYSCGTPSVVPGSAAVTGPRAYVGRIKRVVADLDVSKLEVSVLERAALQALDENDDPLPKLEITPPNAMVNVNIIAKSSPRLLPVFPRLEGTTSHKVVLQWSPRYVPVVFQDPQSAAKASALYAGPVRVGELHPEPELNRLSPPIIVPEGATLVKEQSIDLVVTVKRGPER